MAYAQNSLGVSEADQSAPLRCFPNTVQPKTFAAGSITLPPLCPVAFNTSSNKWVPWSQGTNEVSTISMTSSKFTQQVNKITANATKASDGTFTLTVGGEVTDALDHDADDATIQAALEALSTVGTGGVVCADDTGGGLNTNSGFVTLTFAAELGYMVVTADFSGLTGNAHVLSTLAGGTWTITHTTETAAIPWDATAAQVTTALEALASVEVGDVIVTGGPLNVADIVIEWAQNLAAADRTVSVTDNVTGATVAIAETTKGAAAANGVGTLKGFVWPDEIVLDSSDDVIGNVAMDGQVDYSDILSGLTVAQAKQVVGLTDALRSATRSLGYLVQGLSQVR